MNPFDVPIPERLRRFPLWKGKFLIHFTVHVNRDGTPDFKAVHSVNRAQALAKNWCHLCGQRMEPPYAFIGGPLCHTNRVFIDGPMHEECARYACKVCPYLANPNGDHSDKPPNLDDHHIAVTHEMAAPGRPAKMGLFFADSYQSIRSPDGVVIKAGPWLRVDWTAMPERIESACPHHKGTS